MSPIHLFYSIYHPISSLFSISSIIILLLFSDILYFHPLLFFSISHEYPFLLIFHHICNHQSSSLFYSHYHLSFIILLSSFYSFLSIFLILFLILSLYCISYFFLFLLHISYVHSLPLIIFLLFSDILYPYSSKYINYDINRI